MAPIDLVVILLIANAVQNAMVGPDTSVTGGLIAAAVLIGANYALNQAQRRVPLLRRAIEGSPTLLIDHGQFVEEHLRSEGIDKEHIIAAMREHGIENIQDVQMAVLEVDGSISIVPSGAPVTRTRRHARLARKI
jgi:uncharacterized membrane protein YcaP (DUF421 family)